MDLLFSNLHIILDILLRYMVNLLLGFYRACKPAWWLCFHGIVVVLFFLHHFKRKDRGRGGSISVTIYPFHLWKLLTHLIRMILFWESMSFVWQSILSRRLFLFLPIDCIDFSLPLEPLFLILESNLSSKAIKFCKLWKI